MSDYERVMDLAYYAWTIIANAHGGNWDEATDDWHQAAINWRDQFHNELDRKLIQNG